MPMVEVSNGGTALEFVICEDKYANSITLPGTYTGDYLLIIHVQSGQAVTINTPTISNGGTATLYISLPHTLLGGTYGDQAYVFIHANNSTITSTITGRDSRHHCLTLFKY